MVLLGLAAWNATRQAAHEPPVAAYRAGEPPTKVQLVQAMADESRTDGGRSQAVPGMTESGKEISFPNAKPPLPTNVALEEEK